MAPPWPAEVFTPARARQVLAEARPNRRRLDPGTVAAYAEAMRRGAWRDGEGRPVTFRDGRLGNGQHRLHAIVRAGVTVALPVWHRGPHK